MKLCPKCETVMPLSYFTLNKSNPDGYERVCKTCRKTYRGQTTPSEKTREASRIWLKAHNAELVMRRKLKRLAVREANAEQREAKKAERVANRPRVQLKSRLRIELGTEPPDDLVDLMLVKFMLDRAIKESKHGTK